MDANSMIFQPSQSKTFLQGFVSHTDFLRSEVFHNIFWNWQLSS